MTTIVTRWWWVRHAPVIANKGRIYGQEDLPCDCSDLPAFKFLARTLPENALLVTSNLQRTHQTADGIAGGGLQMSPAIIEPDFREQSFGNWQGLTYEEFGNLRDGLVHRYWLTPAFERAPNGESFSDLVGRTVPSITKLTAEHAGRNIISVAHGGTIRAAIAFAVGVDVESALAFSIDNLSITRLDHIASDSGNSWRIGFLNLRYSKRSQLEAL